MDVDEIADLQDELEAANIQEKHELFAGMASENLDELEDELEELMACETEQMADLGCAPIGLSAHVAHAPATNSAALDDEMMLEALMGGGSSPIIEETKVEVKPTVSARRDELAPAKLKPVVHASAKPVVQAGPKPDFKRFITGMNSLGIWQNGGGGMLSGCLEDGDTEDEDVRQILSGMSITHDLETVYLTLLAWFILEEAFEDEKDQWQLIVDKTKSWLESVGVTKPTNLAKKFTLSVIY